MFEKLLALFERLVIAQETIAATTGEGQAADPDTNGTKTTRTAPKGTRRGAAPDKDEDEDDKPKGRTSSRRAAKDDEPEDKPKRGAGRTKKDPNRTRIEELAAAVIKGDSDKCADEFDDMLEKYEVKSVKDLKDADIEDFLADLEDLVDEYYKEEK